MIATEQETILTAPDPAAALAPILAFAGALLDADRLRVMAALLAGPVGRADLAAHLAMAPRDLLRHLGALEAAGLITQEPLADACDETARYSVNAATLRATRQAFGKLKGRLPRPTDARELILAKFMPAGKLVAFPVKEPQYMVLLEAIATRFAPATAYTEREVNAILEPVHADYCTLRRALVDHGYLQRGGGIYRRTDAPGPGAGQAG